MKVSIIKIGFILIATGCSLIARSQSSALEIYGQLIDDINNETNIQYTIDTKVYAADTVLEAVRIDIWKIKDGHYIDMGKIKVIAKDGNYTMINDQSQEIHLAKTTVAQMQISLAQQNAQVGQLLALLEMKGKVKHQQDFSQLIFNSEKYNASIIVTYAPVINRLLRVESEINEPDLDGVVYDFLNKKIIAEYQNFKSGTTKLPITRNQVIQISNSKPTGAGKYNNYTIHTSYDALQ